MSIYIHTILLALIQAITEFLPISSSGHLVIYHQLVEFPGIDELAFDVALHFGTLLALIVYFRRNLITYSRAFFSSLKKWNLKNDINQRLSWYLILSIIPAGLVGYFFEDIIETLFRNIFTVSITLIIGGLLFFIVEKIGSKTCEISSLTPPEVIKISLAQVLSLIPGVSRSGITIITGLAVGLNREAAASFSFLMAIPIIFLAWLL